ncbi:unnamed protein product [Phytophthora lilii]|uniref:Unnamed protein product n=1 Tax=Phytophthora lilii TaxID=2077276 RepID=A0A9W6TC55_9STRA|nr:unnamed protein product [Phytophthora lilii]
MNIHHDAPLSRTHNVAAATHISHTHPASASRAPSAGSLRSRGSSKRNQNQKGKKLHPDGTDTLKSDQAAHGSVLTKRLASAVRTKRLDLSLPRQFLASSEPSAQSQPLRLLPFQIFPSAIIEHVKQGHHLNELWLTNHHIGSLPAEISVFTKLRVLNLSGNALTALPEELCHLTSLEALHLEKNRLQAVPAKVVFPPQLRELRLDNNQLSIFPTQITKLRLLNRLGLSHNQLKVLPEQIHRLRNLVELDMDYNRLDVDLPDGFAALQRLERLGLEGNYLAEKPTILNRLPALSYIRLSGNRGKHFLRIRTGGINISGSRGDILSVPKRHDGYFQCVETRTEIHDNDEADPSHKPRILQGLIPCSDQNLLNMMAHETCVSQAAIFNEVL